MKPRLVFADPRGEIFDHPDLEAAGCEGTAFFRIPDEDWIPIPDGTKLFTLPGRLPVGWDLNNDHWVTLESARCGKKKVMPQAVSAFLPPAHTRTYLPANFKRENIFLPLWAYAAVGWRDGAFCVAGLRVDDTSHWDPENYDDRTLLPLAEHKLADCKNRLLNHLRRCATEYHCFAAKNLFYGRWECPLPVSPSCNADCVGCISLQPEGKYPASHERLNFLPSEQEILEIAVPHLENAGEAVVSFGQGCEGEPLLQADLIEKVIRRIRERTVRGVIHMNTNGSRPDLVRRLCEAGLNSIRVSLNSAQDLYYERYYRPKGYRLADVKNSIAVAREYGVFTSINLLTFPGLTDRQDELASLMDFIRESGLAMIQWKNLNIDPDVYAGLIGSTPERTLGIRGTVGAVRTAFPHLQFGYFNRPRVAIDEFRRSLPSP